VLSSLFVFKLDSEVIDHERECNSVVFVTEEACSSSLMVAMRSEMFDESVLRELSVVRKAVQAFDDLKEDSPVMCILMEFVFGEDGGKDEFYLNAHPFRARECGVEVKVLDIDCHEFGVIGLVIVVLSMHGLRV
jgi:hypothetical protein